MTKRVLFLFIALVSISISLCGQSFPTPVWKPAAKGDEKKFADRELLVKFRAGRLPHSNAVHAALGGRALREFATVRGLQLVKLTPGRSVQAAAAEYRANPEVEYAEPNYVVKLLGTPNDPFFSQQWALSNPGGTHAIAGADIEALNAWSLTTGSSNIVVATLDTGVDYLHPDLAANIFSNPADCNNNGLDDDGDGYVDDCHGINTYDHTSDPMDDFGHGTHVAGIIGATGNNGLGVTGVNWNIQILPCKFLNSTGYGTIAGAIECLNYIKTLKDRGVNIVATNNSWGGLDYSQALGDAIAAQRDDGILFVAAAGNEFSNNDFLMAFPADAPFSNVISVASSTNQDRFSDFTNTGPHSVHLAAPGDQILSTLPSGTYGVASGTSMAAPYVTGVIALLKAQDPSRDWKKLKNLILSGGDSVAALAQTITGRRLNAYGSMTCGSTPVYARLRPSALPASVSVNTPLTIRYMNINCDSASSQLQGTVAETGETITLKDDGVAPDEVANDGVWTANWAPAAVGTYTINVQGGDSFPVEVLTPYAYVQKTPEYQSIAGTSLDLGDDEVAALDAPFPISFGGSQFQKLYISSNGTISLSSAFKAFYNRWIPTSLHPDGTWDSLWDPYQTTTLIAPWWDDLYPVKGTQRNVFWQVIGSAPTRELVIEWRNVGFFECHSDTTSSVTFEIVFKEGSNHINFEYGNTSTPNCAAHNQGTSATAGIQTSGTQGTQWSFNNPYITPGSSVEFLLNTEPLPTNPVPTITALVPNHTAATGGTGTDFSIVVQGTNFVPGSEVMWGGSRLATSYVSSAELHATIPWFDVAVSQVVQISVFNPTPGGGTSNQVPFGVGVEPPYIASLVPSTIVAGSGSFDLTIKGSGLTQGPGGFIYFGNNQRQITSFTSTEIHARIFASDVATPGTYKVSAFGSQGWMSNQVDFVVTAATPAQAFNDGHGNTTGGSTRSLPLKFMGWSSRVSGSADYTKWFSRARVSSPSAALTSTTTPLPAGVSLPPSTSLPGVRLNPSYPAGYIPTGVVAADFNHDGNVDWAISNGGDNNIYVYMGHGDGTFEPASIIPLRGFSPVMMVGADLRKNGNTDLIVAEIDSFTIGVLLSNGDGTFAPELMHYVQGPVYSVNVGDFNADGIPDILYGVDSFESFPGTQGLSYFPGRGNGDFGQPVLGLPDSMWAQLAYRATVADLTKTGRSDVIVSNLQVGTDVFENTDGILKKSQTIGYNVPDIGYYEYNSDVGDVDEDGCPDVVINSTFGMVKVMFGHCDGTFEIRDKLINWGLGEVTFGMKLVDVNGDGHLDVVSGGILDGGGYGYGGANGGLVSVMLGDGKGHFDYPRVYPAEQGIYDLAVADINHDGKPDIVTANQDSDSFTILLNDGKGGFGSAAGQYIGIIRDGNGGAINDPIGYPLTFDVNGDGKPDIVMLSTQQYADSPYPLVTVLNQGNGKFSNPIRTPLLNPGYLYPFDYAVADFRNSGKLDILFALNGISGEGYYAFAANQGDGTWKGQPQTAILSSYARFATGDFDGDGTVDAVAIGFPNTITFLHSNGDGTFTQKPAGTLPTSGIAPYVGAAKGVDINHDGKLDLLLHTTYNQVPYNDHAVVLFLGNGDGTFQPGQIVVPNAGYVAFADVNHDGITDILNYTVWSSTEITQVSPEYLVYLGQQDATFTLAANYDQYKEGIGADFGAALVSGKFSSAYADYEGDGNADLAALQQTLAFPRRTYLQFMKGLADGTFVPNYTMYSFGNYGTAAPLWSADFDSDGKADMLEYDAYTASFHILPGLDGKKLDAVLLTNPVKGYSGTVRIVLGAPSTSDTAVSLAVSDANISLPAAVTISSGSAYLDVPFTIGPSFNMNRQFRITATVGSASASAYGVQVSATSPVGFKLSTYTGDVSGIPGGDSFKQMTFLYSIAGYSGHISLKCANLPPGATCFFDNPEVDLQRGSSAMTYTGVHLAGNIPVGVYSFQIQASDGTSTASSPMTLNVNDFSLNTLRPYVELLSGGSGKIPIGVLVTGPTASISYTCTVANGGGTCSVVNGIGEVDVKVQAGIVPLGAYPITLTASSGDLSHSLALSLRVVDVTASFSSTTIQLKAGSQGQLTIHLQAPNGLKDSAYLSCSYSPNMSCNAVGSVEFPNGATSADAVLYFSVPSNYPFPKTSAKAKPPHANPWLIGIVVLPFGIMLLGGARHRIVSATLLLLLALCLVAMVSCGGGSSGGGGGGGINPPPNPPPSQSATETFTVSLTSTNFTKTLGTITVKITN
ncbi:MAG: FG-GAP-like repeat-containing protein [Acidobacteriaceae bacterium]